MPYKKKTTKGKRPYRKPKTYKKKPSTIVNLSTGVPHGFANKGFIRFASQTEGNLGGGTLIDAPQVFYGNSVYDPLATSGSEQPPGFDLVLSANGPFLRYRVLKANCKVTFVNLADVATRVAIYVADAAIDMSLITAYNLTSSDKVRSTILTPKSGARDMCTIKRSWNFVKMFKKKVVTDNDYQAAYNANPADLIYVYIIAQSLDGSSYVNVQYSYEMVQHTMLEDIQLGEGTVIPD